MSAQIRLQGTVQNPLAITVTIGGRAVTGYLDSRYTSPVTFPYTALTNTTIYFPNDDTYTISVMRHGTEITTSTGVPATMFISNGTGPTYGGGGIGSGELFRNYPDATNTGIAPGSVLTSYTGVYTPTANQVVSNMDISGYINVGVAGVTIKNCRIKARTWNIVSIVASAGTSTLTTSTPHGLGAGGTNFVVTGSANAGNDGGFATAAGTTGSTIVFTNASGVSESNTSNWLLTYDSAGVNVTSGGTANIFDCEIAGHMDVGIQAAGTGTFNAQRINMYGQLSDGFKPITNCTIKDNYLHDFTPSSGAHADGVQCQQGVSNLLIDHNTILMGSEVTSGRWNSAILISPDLIGSGTGPVTITNNLLSGGGYFTLRVVDGNNGAYHQGGLNIRGNRFINNAVTAAARINEPFPYWYGWGGNVYDDTSVDITVNIGAGGAGISTANGGDVMDLLSAAYVTGFLAPAYVATYTPNQRDGRFTNVGVLTGPITINAPATGSGTASMPLGTQITLMFTQDATGTRAITWNAIYKKSTTLLDAGGGASTRGSITFTWDGTNWIETAVSPWH